MATDSVILGSSTGAFNQPTRLVEFTVTSNPFHENATFEVSAAAVATASLDLGPGVGAHFRLEYTSAFPANLGGFRGLQLDVLFVDRPTTFEATMTDWSGTSSSISLEHPGAQFTRGSIEMPLSGFQGGQVNLAEIKSFELSVAPDSAGDLALQGFSIVQAVPEPGTVSLLLLSSFVVLIRRR
ncbi:MAG: PEP-CTERM sorting domain-containing protein [Verrucomicrobiales bacterium]